MAREFTVVIERDEEGYYVADVPDCADVTPKRDHSTPSWKESGKLSSFASKPAERTLLSESSSGYKE